MSSKAIEKLGLVEVSVFIHPVAIEDDVTLSPVEVAASTQQAVQKALEAASNYGFHHPLQDDVALTIVDVNAKLHSGSQHLASVLSEIDLADVEDVFDAKGASGDMLSAQYMIDKQLIHLSRVSAYLNARIGSGLGSQGVPHTKAVKASNQFGGKIRKSLGYDYEPAKDDKQF